MNNAMYQVWTVYEEKTQSYYVVNMVTHKVQSAYLTLLEARQVAAKLNAWQANKAA